MEWLTGCSKSLCYAVLHLGVWHKSRGIMSRSTVIICVAPLITHCLWIIAFHGDKLKHRTYEKTYWSVIGKFVRTLILTGLCSVLVIISPEIGTYPDPFSSQYEGSGSHNQLPNHGRSPPLPWRIWYPQMPLASQATPSHREDRRGHAFIQRGSKGPHFHTGRIEGH